MGFNASRARQVLADMKSAQQAKWRAEADELRLLCDFADEYAILPPVSEGGRELLPVLDGTERLVPSGDDGTPMVAEFAALEAAAVLGRTVEQVDIDLHLAMSLRHRLPNAWRAVMTGRIRAWQAMELVGEIRSLSWLQALDIDEHIAPRLGSMSHRRVRDMVRARLLELIPDEMADKRRRQREQRHVSFDQTIGGDGSYLGTTIISGCIDTADSRFLDAQLDRLASILEQGGSTDTLNARRALSLGLLATPARALQLLQASLMDELPNLVDEGGLDPECPARGQRGHACGTITTDPTKLLPRSELIVHVSAESLNTGQGLIRAEQIGPLLTGWIKDLLGDTNVTVRPMLHPDDLVPTDAYECPSRMREWVRLRNPFEAFPFSHRRSGRRGMDLDHTIPWQPSSRPWTSTRKTWLDPTTGELTSGAGAGNGETMNGGNQVAGPNKAHERGASGAEGLTRPDNLGFLSRRVHRAKTHGGWELTQPSSGTFLWRSPLGFGYLVTPSHAWMITDPTGQILPTQLEPHEPAQQPAQEYALTT